MRFCLFVSTDCWGSMSVLTQESFRSRVATFQHRTEGTKSGLWWSFWQAACCLLIMCSSGLYNFIQLTTLYNFNAPLEQKRTAVDPASALQIMARKLVWKATLLGLGLFGSCVQAEQKGGQIYNILCMLYLENRQNIYWS